MKITVYSFDNEKKPLYKKLIGRATLRLQSYLKTDISINAKGQCVFLITKKKMTAEKTIFF